MKTMPEEMTFAASIVTLGSMLLFVFTFFYGINNSLSRPLIFMLLGGLIVIFSSFVRIFGAFFRIDNKINIFHYEEESPKGRIEKYIFYSSLLIGLVVFVIGILPFVYNFITL